MAANMPIEQFDRKEIPSFGRCIYCYASADQVELTDEHVIPYSLGGRVTISDGSCRECARETTKIEGELGRKIYWEFRAHVNAPTYRRKERPTELPFLVSIEDGPPQKIYAPIKDHPFFTYFPAWGLPGLLGGDLPSARFPEAQAHIFHWIPENIRETLNIGAEKGFKILNPEMHINAANFARSLAKIAYCQAVVTFGLDGFRHLVMPDLILGRYPYISYFVGSEKSDPPVRTDRAI